MRSSQKRRTRLHFRVLPDGLGLVKPYSRTMSTREYRDERSMPSDPFQMAMIHRTFRREFDNLSGLIRAVAPGDTHTSRFIGSYLGNLISVLHHHHDAEDELLWPKLQDRAPSYGESLQRAQDEHAAIAEAIDKVESIRPLWARCAHPRLAEQLGAAIEELSAHADEHFRYEELNVVPLIRQYISCEEWQNFIDRGAAYVNVKNLWFSLAYSGFLLGNADRDEQRRFLASLPVALRTVVKMLGGLAHASYRTKLYGARG
jgi:Hemerythrin HHE cation binding domain